MKKITFLMLIAFVTLNLQAQQWPRVFSNYLHAHTVGSDYLLTADFTGDGKEEVLTIRRSGFKRFVLTSVSVSPVSFLTLVSSGTSDKIGTWTINPDDKYYCGKLTSRNAAYLMTFSPSRKDIRLYSYNKTSKTWTQTIASQNQWLGGWKIQSGDRFILGDFRGHGIDDILCISSGGYATLMSFTGSGWQHIWSNGGNGKIGGVGLNNLNNMSFAVGNFVSTDAKKELFTIQGTWATFLRYNPSRNDWDWIWSQYGANNFATWPLPINKNTRIITGKFGGSPRDQILFVQEHKPSNGHSGKTTLVSWNNPAGTFHNIYMTGHPMNSDGSFGLDPGSATYLYSRLNWAGRAYLLQFRNNNGYMALARYNGYTPSSAGITLNSINEVKMENIISIYPNPATDHINIEYQLEENTELTIYSMDGKVIEQLILNSEMNEIRIETPHYKSGMYMYKYGSETGKFIIK